ncbi:hypothetical protein Vadar_012346 [Vaccinium darrowii]|uniref:Uncharacterized protein n=1 Tax=Vaccinium darrowii TaxID=229202 RepID=A0ACB7ZC72_9ERIC|nr:hypothetical protein Vadar_012346 [Vaccinium darrowii]
MNGIGRQRSGAPTVRHQRQYSDHLLDALNNGRCLQHFQSSNDNDDVPPLQAVPCSVVQVALLGVTPPKHAFNNYDLNNMLRG